LTNTTENRLSAPNDSDSSPQATTKQCQAKPPKARFASPINGPLSVRQKRYIEGMLQKLIHQHRVVMSDPVGLKHEVYFAMTSPHFFSDKPLFQHRVNIIAKLLRTQRWTTPFGYEKYDPKGQQQRSKCLTREAAWSQQKNADRASCQSAPSGHSPKPLGDVLQQINTAAPPPTFQHVAAQLATQSVADKQGRLETKLQDIVTGEIEHLQSQIQSLHQELTLPHCSQAKQALLAECIARHQDRIQIIQSLRTLPVEEAIQQIGGQ